MSLLLTKLALAILATWRVAAWFWMESGAEGLRGMLCRIPFLARQIGCYWCVTFWVGLLAALVAWLWWPLLVPFALSGAALLLSGGGRIVWREMMEG